MKGGILISIIIATALGVWFILERQEQIAEQAGLNEEPENILAPIDEAERVRDLIESRSMGLPQ